MKKLLLLLSLSVALFARNDVPSCYEALKMTNPNESTQKELFILVDQTTVLDKNLMIYTYKNMMKFIKNGYAVKIASLQRVSSVIASWISVAPRSAMLCVFSSVSTVWRVASS